MTLRTFPVLHDLSDSLFADRFNRIDRLFSQLTGSTPLPSSLLTISGGWVITAMN